ncbi:MAG: FkbM family methyltransferase [Chloroflexi bacterium]|nr:FkbM family methyltransferase [Chloroflexota bacterium]
MFLHYARYLNRPLPARPTFFDVGANRGQWIEQVIPLYPDCTIYAFEPIPGITPRHDNVILQNCAVDINEGEQRVFYVTGDNTTSSLLELEERVTEKFTDFTDDRGILHKASDFDIMSVIKVRTIRLDKFVDEAGISEIHYLKIDTEGNDLNVLKSLGEKSNIVWAFEIEVWNEKPTLFKGSACGDECLDYVESKGFSVVEKFIHGRGKTADLLCVRNSLLR